MNRTMNRGRALLSVAVLATTFGCGKSLELERMDPTTDIQYNTKWSQVDNQMVAEQMVASLLGAPWLIEFETRNPGKKPVIIVDDVHNDTAEHLDVKSLTDLVRTKLVNSRRVTFLNNEARQAILEEYKYQASGAVDPSKAVKTGRQYGATYLLSGNIASIASTLDKKKIVTYKTTLNLTSLETAAIEWTDFHEIAKHFEARGHKL